MEEGKIKNTITRSFELKDYRIEEAELSGFWADLLSKEELTVEVNYKPEKKTSFSPEDTAALIRKTCGKCESFQAQVPENIKCELTFKDFGEKVYKAGQPGFELDPKELEELKVRYRFYVAYYI
ncbi:hypothetical protein FTO70_12820 [Methanosarcina sp. KYL-1]|uniref:hypothetical protein n=1 Tax=Methanosarcina sp. KYL-1 TaxID=2602068 RepID=UPI00210079F9|nr:hypothetical protein [Methanosarcina sp. KYL-1]MCQ1536535.1 hypothetical protein [Methanosarcina sp. KYL-1]